jgi:hypothetical protein
VYLLTFFKMNLHFKIMILWGTRCLYSTWEVFENVRKKWKVELFVRSSCVVFASTRIYAVCCFQNCSLSSFSHVIMKQEKDERKRYEEREEELMRNRK